MQSSPVIWTIGHSNHTFEHFAKLLQAEGVEVVVDVRSYPYSRIAPHFNREELEVRDRLYVASAICYLGEELGGRPTCEDALRRARATPCYGPMSEEEAVQRRDRAA